ncbi:MAG: Dabb family protein [Planctomycetia bacterium]
MAPLSLLPKLVLALAVVGFGLAVLHTSGPVGAAEKAAAGQRRLRHVVLFKFKDSSTPADVARIEAAFRGLPATIKEIAGFEWGTDISPEGKAQGFTHCFLVTFATEADRDTYLPHPAHKEFVALVGPHVDKVCVVDYWTRD